MMMYYSGIACCGIVFNVWLYFDDLKNRGGILDAVDTGENLEELMTSPLPSEKRKLAEQMHNRPDDDNIEINVDEKIHQDLLTYKQDKETRDTLKRSLAKQSMGGQH